jgi:aminoglycoside phosphotransferase (APT) family kinase protein
MTAPAAAAKAWSPSVREINSILTAVSSDEQCVLLPPEVGSPRTSVYVLRDLVVKLTASGREQQLMRERCALGHLAAASLPVPRELGHGVLASGAGWIAMTRMPGASPRDAARPAHELSPALATQIGALAARLHAAPPPPGFGTWERDPGISLVLEHATRVDAVLGRARALRTVEPRALDRLSELLATTGEALVAAPERPVLAHRDLQPSNVLTDDDGVVSALVDFEAAGGGDPAEDFSRVALDWTSLGFAAFCRGYAAGGGRLGRDAAERVTFHVLYWVALIFGAVGVSFPEYLAPAQVALERVAAGERPTLGASSPTRQR